MDISIEKKSKPKFTLIIVLCLLVVVSAVAARYFWGLSQADFSIDGKTLTYSQVRQGKFTVSVRGSGILVPDNVAWISSGVEAKVERIIVKAGKVVRAGDVIAELSNPELKQQLAEAQWEYEAQQAELEAERVSNEMDHMEKRSDISEAKMNYESSALRLQAERQLRKTNAISKLDYERTVLENNQQKERWMVGQQELKKMEENIKAQSIAQLARLKITQKNMERLQKEVDDLLVRATMNSVVLEMPLEVGQRISVGTNIAKLVQEDSLIAELQVPEIQIRQVKEGQKVIIDTRNNKVAGTVFRVDPSVINGSVQVDVAFSENLPDDARPDLSVDGEIKITEIDNAFYVGRPLYSQSQSQTVFYRLSADKQFAERVNVNTGFGSSNQIQIIDGLQVGDTIVTSDPTGFDSYKKIRIN